MHERPRSPAEIAAQEAEEFLAEKEAEFQAADARAQSARLGVKRARFELEYVQPLEIELATVRNEIELREARIRLFESEAKLQQLGDGVKATSSLQEKKLSFFRAQLDSADLPETEREEIKQRVRDMERSLGSEEVARLQEEIRVLRDKEAQLLASLEELQSQHHREE